jgi:hypothetical protein
MLSGLASVPWDCLILRTVREKENIATYKPDLPLEFAEKLSGWLESPVKSILSPESPVRSVSPMVPLGTG